MPLFDVKCDKCGHIWEEMKRYDEESQECSECGSNFTRTLPPLFQTKLRAKDPYEYLDGPIPDSKPIKSYANDRRRGGKDTT